MFSEVLLKYMNLKRLKQDALVAKNKIVSLDTVRFCQPSTNYSEKLVPVFKRKRAENSTLNFNVETKNILAVSDSYTNFVQTIFFDEVTCFGVENQFCLSLVLSRSQNSLLNRPSFVWVCLLNT